jgi:hypothetical protein
LSGKPKEAGTFNFTVSAKDAKNKVINKPYSIKIVPPVSIKTSILANGQVAAQYKFKLTALGGYQPYHWQVDSLPSGLILNNNGVIKGKPASNTQGLYTPNFTVTDDTGKTATKQVTFEIIP